MPDSMRVLCVGDGLSSISHALERHSDTFVAIHRSSPADAIARLEQGDVDCLVSEVEPTDQAEIDGLELLRTVRDREPSLPFILVTDDSGTGTNEAIAAGVTDFHTAVGGSEQVALLASRIELAVDRAEPAANARITAAVSETDDGEGNSNADDQPLTDITASDHPELEQYRPFVDGVADPMYVLDEQRTCVVVNDAFLEYTGYERSQVEGRDVDQLIDDTGHEAASTTIESLYERADESRDDFEVTITAADGETRIGEAHVTVVTDDAGEYAGSVGVIRDITERKERIRELGRYEAIVETAPIGLFAVDEDGHIIWHNEEFTNDLGIPERDLVGTDFAELAAEGFFPDATLENYIERVRHLLSSENDDERATFETEWFDANGERGITETNMGLLPLEDGEFAGTVYAFRNITERVQYEEELERQNDRLEKFASLVSHDLRNPLNIAQGHLDLIAMDCENDSIEETRWAINRMEELIDDLLTLARYGRTVADRERIELADLAEVAWAGVDTADATLVADLDGPITGHEGRVRELLENLFRNAVDHGGTDVTVTVGHLADDREGFFVEDNGSGLPDTGNIFEFGHTTADEGTGLGLGIVSEIADAHGWDVNACDAQNGGARFEIRGVTVGQDEHATE